MCTVEIESFGYTMSDLKYAWNAGDTSVQMSQEVTLPQFKVLGHRQRLIEVSLTSGNYSRLLADVVFTRDMGYYLIQVHTLSRPRPLRYISVPGIWGDLHFRLSFHY